jgi:omega-6 fatty acid desaturase (delta-12 desaturase)
MEFMDFANTEMPNQGSVPATGLPALVPRKLVSQLKPFSRPHTVRSIWELAITLVPFFGIVSAMLAAINAGYLIALALAPLAGLLLLRIFIIQHDCGHGAFFRTRRSNDTLGIICSLVTLAPYAAWKRQHAGHHGVWNNLDQRQSGLDIYSSCLTVAEYRALTPGAQWRRQ